MINNDILRSLRYTLNLGDVRIAEIIKLADYDISREEIAAFLKKEDEADFQQCDDKVLVHFLDGLIIYRRGKKENPRTRPEIDVVNNNVILKKLRLAFELKEEDMHQLMEAASFKVSRPELNALFRKEGHKNYRPCGDQFLRNFLKGLTLRVRG
jgi:uncharacterized protein YehS (DUF1456 family)